MEGYLNIINSRINDLVQISIQERKNNGLGVLFMDFTDKLKLNCYFLKIDDKQFPPQLRTQIIDRYENSPKSIIYFNVYDENISEIVEIDLDKNSNFHNSLTKTNDDNNEGDDNNNNSNDNNNNDSIEDDNHNKNENENQEN